MMVSDGRQAPSRRFGKTSRGGKTPRRSGKENGRVVGGSSVFLLSKILQHRIHNFKRGARSADTFRERAHCLEPRGIAQ